jgi:ATP-binding cassette subfamily F protein 3
VLAADTERAALLAELETEPDGHRHAEIEMRLVDIGAHAAPARAAKILSGLGFDTPALTRPVSDLSGGWRMRVALAAVLFSEPDLLLLDEPTNYLDLEGTIWLEGFLKTYPRTSLIVSHDRDLLNKVSEWTLHLEHGKLTLYRGGYDQFERQRAERLNQQQAAKDKQDAQRKHIQAFVDRFRAKASKARQAQSRLKVLAKLTPIAAVVEDPAIPIRFPEPAPAAPPLITFEQVIAGYVPGKAVLRDVNLRIDQDDRIALLGSNGNGKSTFAKLLAGALAPQSGEIVRARKLKVGYFAQHQLDALHADESPYQHLRELMPDAPEHKVRARLGSFGFSADKADRAVETLSGGEKTRLLLAMVTFAAPELLVLDEPTNHLDIDSREALIHALNEYQGAVLMISHDPHLVEACADQLWLVAGGVIRPWEDDLEAYRRYVITGKMEAPPPAEVKPNINKAEARREAALRREKLKPLKQKITALEQEVARLSKERKAIEKALGNPEIYAKDPKKAQEVVQQSGALLRALSVAEEQWLAAQEEYDAGMKEAEEA